MPRPRKPYDNSGASAAQLLKRHAPLVKRIAYHLMARLPDSVLVEDLIQAGLEGLLEAANNFESGRGASFETFAGIRIRGAMIDEVRRGDWSPRSVHRNTRRMLEVYETLETRLARAPTSAEQAEALGVDMEQYQAMAKASLGVRLCSLDETVGEERVARGDAVADAGPGPDELIEAEDTKARLAAAITRLPERDQLLLNLYYVEELNLKEIGKVLGVSESRVSQLHSQATLKLRSKMIEK